MLKFVVTSESDGNKNVPFVLKNNKKDAKSGLENERILLKKPELANMGTNKKHEVPARMADGTDAIKINTQQLSNSQKSQIINLYNKNNNYKLNNSLYNSRLNNNHNNSQYTYNSKYRKKNNVIILNQCLIKEKLEQINNNDKKINNITKSRSSNNTPNNSNSLYNDNNNGSKFVRTRSRHKPMIAKSREAIKLSHSRSPSVEATHMADDFKDFNGRDLQDDASDTGDRNLAADHRWSLRSSIGSFVGRFGGLPSSAATSLSSICTDLEVFSDKMMNLCYDDDELGELERMHRNACRNQSSKKRTRSNQDRGITKSEKKDLLSSDPVTMSSLQSSNGPPLQRPDLLNHSSTCDVAAVDANNNNAKFRNLNIHNLDKDGRIMNAKKNLALKTEIEKQTNERVEKKSEYDDIPHNKFNFKKEDSHGNSNIITYIDLESREHFDDSQDKNYSITRVIRLKKRKDKSKLGFTVVGGCKGPQGWLDVHIKAILPDGLAEENALLKTGDRLLSINQVPLTKTPHHEAVRRIKKASKHSEVVEIVVGQGQALEAACKKKSYREKMDKIQKTETKNTLPRKNTGNSQILHKLNSWQCFEKEPTDRFDQRTNQQTHKISYQNTQQTNQKKNQNTNQNANFKTISLLRTNFQFLPRELQEDRKKQRNSLESSESNNSSLDNASPKSDCSNYQQRVSFSPADDSASNELPTELCSPSSKRNTSKPPVPFHSSPAPAMPPSSPPALTPFSPPLLLSSSPPRFSSLSRPPPSPASSSTQLTSSKIPSKKHSCFSTRQLSTVSSSLLSQQHSSRLSAQLSTLLSAPISSSSSQTSSFVPPLLSSRSSEVFKLKSTKTRRSVIPVLDNDECSMNGKCAMASVHFEELKLRGWVLEEC